MNLNRNVNRIGMAVAIIVFIVVKYLPAQTRNLLPLLFAIVGFAISIHLYKKNSKYEFKLLLVSSSLMIILSLAYIEHKVLNTSYLLNLYGFLSIGGMLVVFYKAMIKSYNNGAIFNFIVYLLLTISITLILILVILIKVFGIQL